MDVDDVTSPTLSTSHAFDFKALDADAPHLLHATAAVTSSSQRARTPDSSSTAALGSSASGGHVTPSVAVDRESPIVFQNGSLEG